MNIHEHGLGSRRYHLRGRQRLDLMKLLFQPSQHRCFMAIDVIQHSLSLPLILSFILAFSILIQVESPGS